MWPSDASSSFQTKFNTTVPIDRITEILTVTPVPLVQPFIPGSRRHERRFGNWTGMEDVRLLAGIHEFGQEKWCAVAKFVGNGRTGAQCSQRWRRGLDPKISHNQWTPEEDSRLLNLVTTHGLKSWMKISTQLGNRSDVQCRYRYLVIQKRRIAQANSEEPASKEEEKLDEAVEEQSEVAEPKEKTEDTVEKEVITLESSGRSMSEIFWFNHS
jgi:hypothetical protein